MWAWRVLPERTLAAWPLTWKVANMTVDSCRLTWDPFPGWSDAQRALPITVSDMADALGVKRETFKLWARTGRVPAFQIGSRWMCVPQAVLADILRYRGIFAKADTSVVYDRLQRKLRGPESLNPPKGSRQVGPGHTPGLVGAVAPAALETPIAHAATVSTIVDATELAKILKCSTATIYRMAKADEIPSISVGRQWRFEVAEVLRALREPAELWKQPGRSWSAKRTR